MKAIILACMVISFHLPAHADESNLLSFETHPIEIWEHGGGCRKSSPPGQCCHMDRKTGIVHCH